MTAPLWGLRAARQSDLVPDFVRALPACAGDELAVFDADGTLWTGDVADDFTQWMIAAGLVPGERWPTYMRIYHDDPPTGCEYLLTFFRGMKRDELQHHIARYWQKGPLRQWIWEVIEALHHLAGRGYAVWIVSGTPTDFLLPLQQALPIDEVVGMDFALDEQGGITGEHAGISCAGEGKAKKLAEQAAGRRIRFCAGNGSLDGPMMELAETAWCVYPSPDFARYAQQRGWPVLPRPADFVEEEKFLLRD